MPGRKLPEAAMRIQYVDGFLNEQAKTRNDHDYGYNKNHLPETSKKPRKTVSSFDLIKKRVPA